MSDIERITRGVKSFNQEMDEMFSGRTLTCLTCGRTEPSRGSYIRTGWPKCCNQTMRLGDKP